MRQGSSASLFFFFLLLLLSPAASVDHLPDGGPQLPSLLSLALSWEAPGTCVSSVLLCYSICFSISISVSKLARSLYLLLLVFMSAAASTQQPPAVVESGEEEPQDGLLTRMYYTLRRAYIPTSPALLLEAQREVFRKFVR
jgi:hypothetical protein